MFKILLVFVAIIYCTVPLRVLSQDNPPVSLDQLVQTAIENNPQLEAARKRTAAAGTVIRQMTAWEAPQIGIEFFNTPVQSFPNPVKNGMETDYFIQQIFPFPGKLSAAGRAAQYNAGMIDQEYHALERRVIRQLKTAYYELYLVQQKIHINAENQQLMKKFIEIALKQYEGGMGIQSDILRAQTEFSSLLNEEIDLRREQRIVEAMINTLINRPVDESAGTLAEIKPDSINWTVAQLQSLGLQNRPELKGMKNNIAMNKEELLFSKREYYPDLMARVMYKDMVDTKNDFWSVMLGINFPLALWSSGKYSSRVEENKLKVIQAENELVNMKNMVLYEIQSAVAGLQAGLNSLKLHQTTIIPQAEQTLHSTLSAYRTGKTEFLMVIDAYRMLLMAKLEYQVSLKNYLVSQAQVEEAVGMNLADIGTQIYTD